MIADPLNHTDPFWGVEAQSFQIIEISSISVIPTTHHLQETVISESEEDKGNFLCGPEWKVRITTKADQELDVKQVGNKPGQKNATLEFSMSLFHLENLFKLKFKHTHPQTINNPHPGFGRFKLIYSL